jgi:hypothetical protein
MEQQTLSIAANAAMEHLPIGESSKQLRLRGFNTISGDRYGIVCCGFTLFTLFTPLFMDLQGDISIYCFLLA